MKRRVTTILSALSLLLCVAVVVMWVRSYWRADAVISHWRSYEGDALHSLMIHVHEGRVTLWREEWQRGGSSSASIARWSGTKPYIDAEPLDCVWSLVGMQLRSFDGVAPAIDGWAFVLPLWLPIVPLALGVVLPWRWAASMAKRSRAGLCPSCNYDLRATPERCPECGLIATPA